MVDFKNEISKQLFGTEDYESIIEILAPSDPLITKFNYECEKYLCKSVLWKG